MSFKHTLQRFVIASSCLLAAPVTCNSILAKKGEVDESKYDYVQTTGSSLVKRVPKGSAPEVGSSASSSATGEAINNFTRANTSVGRTN